MNTNLRYDIHALDDREIIRLLDDAEIDATSGASFLADVVNAIHTVVVPAVLSIIFPESAL